MLKLNHKTKILAMCTAIALLVLGGALHLRQTVDESLQGRGGDGTINQLSPFFTGSGQVRLASSTADFRVPSLASCDTIDTDSNGVMTCGVDGGGGGSTQHTDAGSFVYPQEGDYHSAPFYVGTSTTATSTFVNASTSKLTVADRFNFLGTVFTDLTSFLFETELDTETELEGQLTDVTNVFTNNDGALSDDDLSDNTTSQLSEGSNLYFTDARVSSYIAGSTTISKLGPSIDISDETNLAGDTEIVLTNDTLSIAAAIARDSELHSAVTLSGTPDYITLSGQDIVRGTVDIGDDTNLVGGTNITLTGDTLNVDDAFLVNDADDTTTGRLTVTGGLQASSSLAVTATAGSLIARLYENIGGNFVDLFVDSSGNFSVLNDSGLYKLKVQRVSNYTGVAGIAALTPSGGAVDTNTYINMTNTDQIDVTAGGSAMVNFDGTAGSNIQFNSGNVDIDYTFGTDNLDVLSFDGALDTAILLGIWDGGGATSFEIPNGTAPTTDAAGEIALDTTDNQLIVDDGTNDMVFRGEDKIYNFALGSTTIAASGFASGQVFELPSEKDGFEITQFRCHVVGGTSIVANISDGTNDTETITCGTTVTSDTDVATNDTFTANEIPEIQLGTVTGTPNWLYFTIYGRYTRE